MKSKLLQYCLVGLFILVTLGFTVWSWVLVDTNFTLFNRGDWTQFRALVISLGYFQRQYSANLYVTFILLLTVFSYLVVKIYKGPMLPLIVIIGVIAGLLSYPALSHDLFNYIFDARIATHYHMNPYLYRALDFPQDQMLRFMHWVHRTYPYGPTYLLITIIPSLLGLGYFLLTFVMFKSLHVLLFIISGLLLLKINRNIALIFITSPLIIVEGLVNSHNDFVALAFAVIGIYLLRKHKTLPAFSALLFSGLIKFISLPAILLSAQDWYERFVNRNRRIPKILVLVQPWQIALFGVGLLLAYLIMYQEIQPWYFLNFFIFLPYAPTLFKEFSIALTGLLLSYYPYVLGGEWGQGGSVPMKRSIITWSFLLNIAVLLVVNGYGVLAMHRKKT
ncbi:hypothetical protein KBB12_02850 [Candidatus Woesebacteria bacterium]|nr:hypothetical protein [Candidatus Woesebacteria bacterium]